MVPKHNEEEQSQDKRKASKRHQCQVGMCKRNKTTEKCEKCFKYVCGKCKKTVEKKFYCKKLRYNTIKDFIHCHVNFMTINCP